MNALAERIARLIAAQGPLSVAQFMAMALYDPQDGYYAARDPLGAAGDFITAPDVSQMFGELLGLWIVQAWRDQGQPSPARLVELGPGRGTMMADALRAARADPDFLAAIKVVLIEASPRLRTLQAETLKKSPSPPRSGGEGRGLSRRSSEAAKPGEGVGPPIRWIDHFDESSMDRPLFLLANEFFDALPIRQFVMSGGAWHERMVALDDKGALAFALSPESRPLDISTARGVPENGAVYEVSTAREAIVEQIANAVAHKGGAALIVDYGYSEGAGFGETLQAVSEHKFASILEAPGEADLSSHVDFAALAQAAKRAGATAYGPVEQGTFLCDLGIVQRAETLSRNRLQSMEDQLNRLILPEEMGTLFKALAIVPKGAAAPPGLT
ncbi:MAG TPA: SAM-dependent methyltransferase [Rhizomicrobium sp.]